MSDQIRVNGNVHSWGSIAVRVNGIPFWGFNAIGYGDARERSKVYGMGAHQAPRGRTRGKYNVDPVTLSGPMTSAEALRNALAAAGGGSYGDGIAQITLQYIEAFDFPPITVLLRDCVWVKSSVSHAEGSDAMVEDIEFDCMAIFRNGKTLYDARIPL